MAQAAYQPYEIDENVAVDLVNYVRSNTIRNEQQFLLLCFAYGSGLFENTHHYVSSVTIGTSSSGKSHLKDKADELFSLLNVMDASTGSEKALIYDPEWDEADIVSMGELQQPPEEMIEFLKRAHGGDEEVVIRSTRGNPNDGFETEVIRKAAKSYHFTYAQFDADFEFWNRLLKIPVHESESKNRAVGRMVAGHEDISIGDDDVEYGFDFEQGRGALKHHIVRMKETAPKRTVLPNGSEEFGWDVWDVVEPIFNHSRSESNRVYSMVFNIIRASALLNYHTRDRVQVEGDYEGDERDAIVVDPQDVANVMVCLDVLRSSTHEIDRKKRAIVEAIRAKSGPDDAIEGVEPIRQFLKESDAPEVKASELENILEDLEENFLVEIDRQAGEGGRDVYRAFRWDSLGEPRIEQNADLFEDRIDPITQEPFLESWAERRSEMETTADDLLKTATIESSARTKTVDTSSGSDNGGASLSSWSSTPEDDAPELNPWTEEILERVRPVLDGTRIRDMSEVPVEAFLGLTGIHNPDRSSVDPEATMLDPSQDVWDQPSKPDEWVETETEARREIQASIEELISEGVILFEEIHDSKEDGTVVDATLCIEYE